jgi:glutamyl-tRNA synthetase
VVRETAHVAGRFAPSPTGDLHLGNLRTALAAWLSARSSGVSFIVRMEDLDRVTSSADHEVRQLRDLAALGLDWDGEVVRQSDRFDRYRDAIATLDAAGVVYPCFCTRREIAAEIAASASAPHDDVPIDHDQVLVPDGAYPGTCRELTARQRSERSESGRRPALRLRAPAEVVEVHDVVVGRVRGLVDDVVLQRGDGVPAYNLAVVIDDAAQGVTQVVRGDDLMSSTPRQVALHHLLGLLVPTYGHVPLVMGDDGTRLAKRHGAVTLEGVAELGCSAADVVRVLATTLGVDAPPGARSAADLQPDRFSLTSIPRAPLALAEVYSKLAGLGESP